MIENVNENKNLCDNRAIYEAPQMIVAGLILSAVACISPNLYGNPTEMEDGGDEF